ncbi:MAG: hypothetical protein KKH41_06670 [Candidatus Thermoplasmatota archaeon]|nr:hypothetical protein [Euryarchaeota archaeon]MBU4031536.1 hypothetical protein [Candidatus Thermoplasmatota archaeon]MBU4072166.1 hypothetical protein [Candidatus Thermoplasmatota archaeon]MBU4144081.1 hypothetical protein [Candidatus Thermoplasmatota archaeon]MBU4592251.1 hypothetical protein [Candidatus Thermoplasmatota archaeon]
MMRADVRIQTDNDSEMLASILKGETHDELSRNKICVGTEGNTLTISIEAEDVVSLRAALNSYLRWTKLALDTKETIGVIK